MKIKEKLQMGIHGLAQYGPITIVAFGDSVTQGYLLDGEINFETVYWNRLKQKIHALGSGIPVNVINAGIAGTTAKASVERIDRQVLKHEPDLVIICFGLNDVNRPIEEYLEALKTIFTRCAVNGTDVIFMTPNMLNTYVADDTAPRHLEYAKKTASYQNEGRMDRYIFEAVQLAKGMGIAVCDCYSKWKKISETEDTTRLLANRINHPTEEMHELFADSLFELIFDGTFPEDSLAKYSGMYCE